MVDASPRPATGVTRTVAVPGAASAPPPRAIAGRDGDLALHARKRLKGFELDVAFEAPAGITALFGPSGSGKTQTLRCIAGLSRPDAGRITLGSGVLFDAAARVDVPARSRRVGYVFQQYALFPHLDVASNVGYGLHAWSRAERKERIAELLRLVGLQGHARKHPHELSGGQQQRVALARALAPRPALLLLDEPFASVDATVRARLRDELRALHEQTGVPLVLVTHDPADVRHLAGRVVHYDEGRVTRVDAPATVVTYD